MDSNFGILFLKRLAVLCRVAFSILFKTEVNIDGEYIRLNGPMKFRLFLETMGGAFVKLGQVLVLYPEFLPIGYGPELMGIKNRAVELPFRTMDDMFFRETGRRLEELFVEIDKKPMTSTVTAQIYKGQIYDTSTVTVKIQRPHVKAIFEADYGVISMVLHLLGFFRLVPPNKVEEILAYFVSWTRKSLNFIAEAKNADVLYQHNQKHSSSVIPKQYLEFCTAKVLVQEFVNDAISLEEVLNYKKDNRDLGEEFDPVGIIECFINDELREYFIDGFFHATPHPSNLVFTQNYITVHLDFGIIGGSDIKRIHLMCMLYALSQKDANDFCKHLFEFGDRILQDEMEDYLKADVAKRRQEEKILEKIKGLIFEDFKKEAAVILEQWFSDMENESAELLHKSSFYVFTKILRRLATYGVYLPREIQLFLRAMFLLDTIGLMTSNRYNLIMALDNFYKSHFPEILERHITTGDCSREIQSKLVSLTDLDWEFFKESSSTEKEKIMAARDRISELIAYYGEKYEEVGSMIKNIK